MSFIGIVSDEKCEKKVFSLLKEIEKSHTILYITPANIDNMKNIKFETILIYKNSISSESLRKILQASKYLVINSDIEENLSLLQNLDLTVITYGYNNKATVTASSIEEDSLLLSIQRTIESVSKVKYEPQEIKAYVPEKILEQNIYKIMGEIILILLYGKQNNVENISEKPDK